MSFGQLQVDSRADWDAHGQLDELASSRMTAPMHAFVEQDSFLQQYMGIRGLVADAPAVIRSQVTGPASAPREVRLELVATEPFHPGFSAPVTQVDVVWEGGQWRVLDISISAPPNSPLVFTDRPTTAQLMAVAGGQGWRVLQE